MWRMALATSSLAIRPASSTRLTGPPGATASTANAPARPGSRTILNPYDLDARPGVKRVDPDQDLIVVDDRPVDSLSSRTSGAPYREWTIWRTRTTSRAAPAAA